MGAVQSYAEMERANTKLLRHFLESETEPRLRVWAAWALAVRLGAGARSELTGPAAGDPDSGVRRHLIVVLAGLGERSVLVTLAVSDPDVYVRASACRALASVWPDTSGAFLLDRLRRDEAVDVRRTIVEDLRWPFSDTTAALISCGLADGALEVRTAVIERVLTVAPNERDFPPFLRDIAADDPSLRNRLIERILAATRDEPDFPLVLREVAMNDADPSIRDRLLSLWARRDGGQGILKEALTAPTELSCSLLWPLVRERIRLPWPVLQPFVSRLDPVMDSCVAALMETVPLPEGLSWLLQAFHRYQRQEPDAAGTVAKRLAAVLRQVTWAQLTEDDRGHAVRLHVLLHAREQWLKASWFDEYGDDYDEDIRVPCLEELDRLLGHEKIDSTP